MNILKNPFFHYVTRRKRKTIDITDAEKEINKVKEQIGDKMGNFLQDTKVKWESRIPKPDPNCSSDDDCVSLDLNKFNRQ